VFLSNGIVPEIIPKMDLNDGIEAARQVLKVCYFDEMPTYEGLEHLRAYCRLWDEKVQAFKDRPSHDAHSHGADAFRYMALAVGKVAEMQPLQYTKSGLQSGATYGFTMNDLWDSQPKPSRRIG
jgi:hypothetical protein